MRENQNKSKNVRFFSCLVNPESELFELLSSLDNEDGKKCYSLHIFSEVKIYDFFRYMARNEN